MRFFISLIFFISTLLAFDPSTLIKENKLVKSVYKIHELQLKAFDEHNINNDELMQQMLDNNTEVLRNTLLEIKSNPYTSSFIIENEYQKRVAFLKNRISLNIKRGNKYAVKRDELALAYLKELREINSFLMNVSKKVQEYPTHAEIKAFVLKTIKEHSSSNIEKDVYTTLYRNVINDDNKVAQSIRDNYKQYITLLQTYNAILEYTSENPQLISQKTIFTLIDYDSIINSVNALDSAFWLNQKISFLYLNTGKLVALFIITLLLGLGLYLIKWILRFRLFNFKHYENRKLLRPIRLLLAVTALDYFLLMLMYPLPVKSSIDSFVLFLYVSTSAYMFMEMLAYIVVGYFEKNESSKNQKALISLSTDMLKTLIAISALVVYLNKMGVSLQTVLTTVGIFGLGIALAAKDSMANFFGSLNILLDNTFDQGDFVTIGDVEGEIVKVGLRSTQIRALDNLLIILPNADVAVKPIINWNKRRLGREIKTSISISYQTDVQKLKDLIEDIRIMIENHPDLVQNDDMEKYEKESKEEIFVSKKNLLGLKKERFVYLDSFNDSHLSIYVQTFSKTIKREEWYEVKEKILYSILEILNKHEVEFALPARKMFTQNLSEKQV